MDLTPQNLRNLRTTFVRQFQEAYDETEVYWNKLATLVPSASAQNDYGWMASLPSMTEWIGPRTVHNLVAHSYVLKNKTFELTLGVEREDIEDDNLGIYTVRAQLQGEAAAKHPDELVETLLKDGESTLCFDGQNFFDTDHPINPNDAGAGVYSNYQASGCALDRANFIDVRAEMMAFRNEQGRSLKVRPRTLIVPPALEGEAIEITKVETANQTTAGTTTGGGGNVTRGMADYLVVDELAGEDTTWYMADLTRRMRPFVYQLRRPLSITAKDRNTDDIVLEENQLRFYSDIRDNAGYSLPFLAYKCVA